MLNRRQFIHLGTGAAVTAALYGCSATTPSKRAADTPASNSPADAGTVSSTTSVSSPASASSTAGAASSAPSTAAGATSGQRTLVVVQLNGGNDALNTLVPSDGRYRDARPTLAIPESELVALAGTTEWSLHPQLAVLAAYWAAGHATFLPGIGFSDPDHSHFVSLDRWWRADDFTSGTGWLGRGVSSSGADVGPLYATALGNGAPLLLSDRYQAAVVLQPAAFRFPAQLPPESLLELTHPLSPDRFTALAQRSLGSTIEAVSAFAELLGQQPTPTGDNSSREGGFGFAQGLDLAASLVTGDVGARIVVVSAGGFDTHSNQLTTHADLLTDLAAGIDGFMKRVAAAGAAEQTLLITTSEFGRRVGENASGGFDHGAGGMSMMFGPMVNSGIRSTIDLGDQLDGDVRPTLDPRTMYTACLDWLGLDVSAALGKRYDETKLLRV